MIHAWRALGLRQFIDVGLGLREHLVHLRPHLDDRFLHLSFLVRHDK